MIDLSHSTAISAYNGGVRLPYSSVILDFYASLILTHVKSNTHPIWLNSNPSKIAIQKPTILLRWENWKNRMQLIV